jgi:CYTH domain-containing protein
MIERLGSASSDEAKRGGTSCGKSTCRSSVAEVDVHRGELSGLCIAEVEFSSEGEAAAFQLPAWFGREVTGEPCWANAALARHGVPR